MLNANVAFLAIQSVDQISENNNPDRSPAQIASYLSIIASIGSIILGLLLIRQNRKSGGTADGVVSGIDLQSLFHYCLLKNISAILYDEKQSPSSRTGIAFYLVCTTLRTSNVGVSTL